MMIEQIIINNFKFHKEINLKLNNKDLIIYGENGTGKSSIYLALYSTFLKLLKNIDVNSSYKNRFFENNDKESVDIIFNNKSYIKLINLDKIKANTSFIDKNNIYFANQDILQNITEKDDFYTVIKDDLRLRFSALELQYQKYYKLNNININPSNHKHINNMRSRFDITLKIILNKIEKNANSIIKNHFHEDFKITFNLKGSIIDVENGYIFNEPKIFLCIDLLDKLKFNFNEAKLKLSSIAIFFALINLHKTSIKTDYKLLVLDDFLTSLDMSNRSFILKYIFDTYLDFQKIILTHNLQLYNLVEYMTHEVKHNWDYQNLYSRNNNETIIYHKLDLTLDDIEKKLESIKNYSDFKIIGNLIRKEFEKILHEFEKENQLGTVEKVKTIIDLILNDTPLYQEQTKLIEKIKTLNDVGEIHNLITTKEYYPLYLKEILKHAIFYKKIVMHPSSHHDVESDIFHKEFKQSITVLKELNIELTKIKKLNSHG